MLAIDLRFARFEVWPADQLVRTCFPDGLVSGATRDEDDPGNQREALAQGYGGQRPVWRSLVEHELLHSLVAELVFGRPSLVLRTESGGEFTPTWSRYEEEMLALALQRHLQAGEAPDLLARYPVDGLPALWRHRYAPLLAPLWT